MWEARVSDNLRGFFDLKISPKFRSLEDCDKWIKENCKEIEELLDQAYRKLLDKQGEQTGNYYFYFGSFIRPYNTTQKRFVSGFDY